ncbi:solute carrier family 49 member 4 isoform X1 [Clarias gariepinus]|uniref:solute carrier family 49 member 4 isoform X1 n=1 Tax=Clarias gariepinus TaxID=13013 RepID=UPI00234D8D6B|nr:solute carrier family 49 member 4 isoform X1 [Clarias gariepinus]
MGAAESTGTEREPLLGPSQAEARVQPETNSGRVYGRRWLVLTLFSMLAFLQGMVWNTWGPIQNSAKQAFGFSSTDIAILVIWGPVGFLPWLLFMWLMDKKGLRASLLLTVFFMVLGSALRSVPLTNLQLRRWLIHGGQLLNGLAGPTLMSAGPLLSTTWFAPDQRATATAVASLVGYLGAACSFLIGPLAVPAPNDTQIVNSNIHWDTEHVRNRIEFVLYTELGMIAVLFAVVLLYFPSRPPIPPSVAAASQRLSYRSSICRLLSNMRFLMIALAYSVPTGVLAGWSGVLDMILTPVRISQVDAGWIGFWSTVGGCVFGVAMARFADYIRGMLKLIAVLMLAGASLAATWFTLTCLTRLTHLPSTKATLYTSCILLGIFINSSIPIFFELFIETVYPVPEGITCGVVTFLSNLFTGLLLFFLTFYIAELSWLNWCLTGSCLFSLLLILFFRESYDRLYLDVFVSV